MNYGGKRVMERRLEPRHELTDGVSTPAWPRAMPFAITRLCTVVPELLQLHSVLGIRYTSYGETRDYNWRIEPRPSRSHGAQSVTELRWKSGTISHTIPL